MHTFGKYASNAVIAYSHKTGMHKYKRHCRLQTVNMEAKLREPEHSNTYSQQSIAYDLA